ncbi:hydrogenase nickel incorporation protein HypB [Raineyella fluvialis]|uniref:Hydrogenase maturation factor HypA n=1 Tax=Raineyella fluvialis TaxID=2662261 RepID=A0A5Q2FEF4_9ACTN|nr:hydrogenase nickel incorporation protein HypB [Raineyella fluvialis]QGF23105.1 hydrogenase nickel incorporation protein HypB [Raineyella fluvialis]
MHEVSLCRQLAAAVARATGGREVETVYVDVGQLRQVVPAAMGFAWTFVVKGTALEDASLEMRTLPAELACRACGASSRLGSDLGFDCRACGSPETVLTSGEQFVLTAVDVRTPPPPTTVRPGARLTRGKEIAMGRFHRHDDGTVHVHEHDDEGHGHEQDEHGHDEHGHGEHGPGTHSHDGLPRTGSAELDQLIGDHSGYGTGRERIEILEDIYAENDRLAAANRRALDAAGVRAVNLMSSPGAGKTTLLARTLAALEGRLRVGVVEGDIETPLDAERLAGYGAKISLLNTGDGFGGECHLDAPMVATALRGLDLSSLDLVIIENVGNLVCPAEFDVGEHRKAMVFSITEGEDKPLKYPVMFRAVEAVVLNKMDLAPYLDFDRALFLRNLRAVNPDAVVIEASARTGAGVDAWIDWVTQDSRALDRITPHG